MKKLLFSLLAGMAMVSCANDTVSLQIKTNRELWKVLTRMA